jgi:hypothetical protein
LRHTFTPSFRYAGMASRRPLRNIKPANKNAAPPPRMA